MKYFFLKFSFIVAFLLYAQVTLAKTLKEAVSKVVAFGNDALLPLLFSVVLVWFMWGVFEFVKNAGNQEKRKEGRKKMLWGIIALFAMISYLGITAVFTQTFFSSDPILPLFK